MEAGQIVLPTTMPDTSLPESLHYRNFIDEPRERSLSAVGSFDGRPVLLEPFRMKDGSNGGKGYDIMLLPLPFAKDIRTVCDKQKNIFDDGSEAAVACLNSTHASLNPNHYIPA